MVQNGLSQSIIGKAIDRDLIDLEVTDFRDFQSINNSVDDAPYGGGAGCYSGHNLFLKRWTR